MKCIYCGKKAEYIVGGQSVCKEHIKNPRGDVPFVEDFDEYVCKLNKRSKGTNGK